MVGVVRSASAFVDCGVKRGTSVEIVDGFVGSGGSGCGCGIVAVGRGVVVVDQSSDSMTTSANKHSFD